MPLSTSNEHHNSCSKKTDLNGRRSTERQSDCAYRQQWISEAAYYKAKNFSMSRVADSNERFHK